MSPGEPLRSTKRKKLLEAAREASGRAYCPYSNFPVGAAALTASGSIHTGCNVENASYGGSICAERSVLCRVVAEAAGSIVAVAVYTPTPRPTTPCGICRQALIELAPDAFVYCACAGESVEVLRVRELLPYAFDRSSLTAGSGGQLGPLPNEGKAQLASP